MIPVKIIDWFKPIAFCGNCSLQSIELQSIEMFSVTTTASRILSQAEKLCTRRPRIATRCLHRGAYSGQALCANLAVSGCMSPVFKRDTSSG